MGRRLWNVYDVREFLGELSFLLTLNRYAVWGGISKTRKHAVEANGKKESEPTAPN
ncbi:MAG: hypothetical protein ACM3U1_02345 [Chloroflexota bacterium]